MVKTAPKKKLPKEAGDVFELNAVTPSELAEMLDLPRGAVYERIKSGRLRTYRFGRAHVVRRVDAINAFNAELEAHRAAITRLERALHALKTGG